ncbi:MAG: FkbM family methyltransferase [Pseudomonadota bacterium]
MKRFHPTRVPALRWLLTALVGLLRPARLDTKSGFKLWVPKQDKSIYVADIFLTGYYEKAETLRVAQLLRPGDAVVDVGANIGYYTCLMSQAVGGTGVVYAFEPVPENREILAKNIALNALTNVEVNDVALGEERRRAVIAINQKNRGAHSLVAAAGSACGMEIAVARFDDVVPARELALVKIDVEGYELSVLKGMKGHLDRKLIKHILVEVTPSKMVRNGQRPDELFAMLEAYGFSGAVVTNTVDAKDLRINELRSNLGAYVKDENASFNILFSLSRDSSRAHGV